MHASPVSDDLGGSLGHFHFIAQEASHHFDQTIGCFGDVVENDVGICSPVFSQKLLADIPVGG